MSQIQILLHDLVNKQTVVQGIVDSVKMGYEGKWELSAEEKLEKLSKALISLEKMTILFESLREIVLKEKL